MMHIVITMVHVLACLFLILVVLLQTGKGAEMGAVFGGSSSTVFGSSGAGNFLTRLTTATVTIFMLTSLSLTYLSGQRTTETIFDGAPMTTTVPSEPARQAEPEAAPPAQEPGAEAAPAGEPAPQAGAEPAPQPAQEPPPAPAPGS